MRNKNSRNNREVMKRILGCIRPYWFLVLISLLLAVITVVLTLYIPILTGQAVDLIVGKGDVNSRACWPSFGILPSQSPGQLLPSGS